MSGDEIEAVDRSDDEARHLPAPDRVVVITGGTGGLGTGIVRRFRANGNRVHVPVRGSAAGGSSGERDAASRDGDGSGDGRGGRDGPTAPDEDRGVTFHSCDVTDASEVERFFASVAEAAGRVDVLINGVGGFAMASVLETEPDDWRRMMELNATSAFLCSRAAARHMKGSGWGRIVNVASMPALERGASGMAAYGAAKTALIHFTRSLADELIDDGVTVNAVVPTVIDTPGNRSAMPDASRERWLDPGEIGDVITFLASDAAEIVTGAAIPLSRG